MSRWLGNVPCLHGPCPKTDTPLSTHTTIHVWQVWPPAPVSPQTMTSRSSMTEFKGTAQPRQLLDFTVLRCASEFYCSMKDLWRHRRNVPSVMCIEPGYHQYYLTNGLWIGASWVEPYVYDTVANALHWITLMINMSQWLFTACNRGSVYSERRWWRHGCP